MSRPALLPPAQLGTSLTSWPDFTGEPPGFPWLWCHPLVIDGPAGDAPVPMPAEASLRALAGVGAVEDFRMWNVYGPGILQHADEHQCALAQLTRNTVVWAGARAVAEEAAGSVLAPPVPAVIWVSEPDSFADAIGFWNARALVATITAVDHLGTAILLPPDITAWTDLADAARAPLPGAIQAAAAGRLHLQPLGPGRISCKRSRRS